MVKISTSAHDCSNMIDLHIVSRVLAVISILGIVMNSTAIYYVYRYKHLHNTFGSLCAVLAISNFGILLAFLVWCSYGNLIFDEETLSGNSAKVVGHITLFMIDMKVYAHLGVSINRLISLKYPFMYHSMESKSAVTVVYVVSVILVAFLQVTPLFRYDECFFMYFKEIAVWSYGETPCNDFYSFYVDFVLTVFIMCCIILLDLTSLLTLRKVYEFSQSNDHMRIKRKSEIGFFVQSLCQMVPLILGYTSFDIVSGYASNDWMLFGTTTFVWALLHAVDGIIMTAFQAHKVHMRKKASSTVPVSSTHGSFALTRISQMKSEI